MKRITKYLYSESTRGARSLNFILSTVWLIATILYILKFPVIMPRGIIHLVAIILILSAITSVLSLFSLFKIRYVSLFKCISLHTGSLLQAMIGMGYVNNYPPLEIASIITFMMALWLIGAAYFVMDKELEKKEKKNAEPNTDGININGE